MNLKYQLNNLYNEFGDYNKMVLSTSLNDKVTSRMMSVVLMDGIFYFQTDKTFRKYEQLIGNENVALCIDNIQVEGICKECGQPLHNHEFSVLYNKSFPGSYSNYSSLENEVLFAVKPTFITRWIYKDGIPFIETFDISNSKYNIEEYRGV